MISLSDETALVIKDSTTCIHSFLDIW